MKLIGCDPEFQGRAGDRRRPTRRSASRAATTTASSRAPAICCRSRSRRNAHVWSRNSLQSVACDIRKLAAARRMASDDVKHCGPRFRLRRRSVAFAQRGFVSPKMLRRSSLSGAVGARFHPHAEEPRISAASRSYEGPSVAAHPSRRMLRILLRMRRFRRAQSRLAYEPLPVAAFTMSNSAVLLRSRGALLRPGFVSIPSHPP